jgi:hypothetical protein
VSACEFGEEARRVADKPTQLSGAANRWRQRRSVSAA